MAEFSIHVEPASFTRNQSGRIFGEIALRIGDSYFPDKAWDDFVVVIMGWWLRAAVELLSRKNGRVQCDFMDGPYWFKMAAHDKIWAIECGRDSQLIRRCSVDRSTVMAEMLHAAQLIENQCSCNRWESDDIENLILSHNQLANISKGEQQTSD